MRSLTVIARCAVALVWLYQGTWLKLVAGSSGHRAVVGDVPLFPESTARIVLVAIGVVETILAIWVLTGRWPRPAAAAQTILLVIMNVGGLIWARDRIHDPAGMVVSNLAFLTLVWILAEREEWNYEPT